MTILRVVDENKVNPVWLANYLYLLWSKGVFRALCRRHVNQASVSLERLGDVPLHVPPILEQRAIAHVLTTVRQAIEATERVIEAARQLKKSMMKHLFTYGPVPVDQVDQVLLNETEIGLVPVTWTVEKLGNILNEGGGSIQTGPFGSLLHSSDYVDVGYPFVMPKDMEEGKIRYDKVAFIGQDDYGRLNRYHLRKGDVITARRGELGRSALITEREDGWVCGTGCLRVRPGKLLNSSYITKFFETDWLRSWLASNAIGTTMANLSTRILSDLPFPFPQFNDQVFLAQTLTTIDNKLENETKYKKTLDRLFQSLLHLLMTGKVRIYHSF